MSKTKRDNVRFRKKNKKNPAHSYRLHFGIYYDLHPCTYKKINRRLRRTRAKQALRNGKDIPRFKKTDNYDYHMDW